MGKSEQALYECVMCDTAWTNCTEKATDISAIPVLPGQYRLDNSSETGYACSVEGVCLGGTNPDVQCKEGNEGVLCSVCTKDWYRPTGDGVKKPCKLCPTDGGWKTVVLVSCALVGGLMLFMIFLYCLHLRAKDFRVSLADLLQEEWDFEESEKSPRSQGCARSALCTIEKNHHFQKFKEKKKKTRKRRQQIQVAGRIKKRVGKLGVKLRILVSLSQLIKNVGFVFRVPFPPMFDQITQWLGSIVSISLPDLMPIDCIQRLSYFANMLIKTGLPLFFWLLLKFSSWRAKSYTNKKGGDMQKKDKGDDIQNDDIQKKDKGDDIQKKDKGDDKKKCSKFFAFLGSIADSAAFVTLYLVFPTASVTVIQVRIALEGKT